MIKIIHAYPDFLNLYGEYANMKLLVSRLEGCGEQITVKAVEMGRYTDISDASLIYFGAGTENRMLAALTDFRRYLSELKTMMENGGKVLATGSSMALLCSSVTDTRDGRRYEGFGLVDGTAEIVKGRRYSELVCTSPLCTSKVYGTVNSSIDFGRGEDAAPFAKIERDFSGRLSGSEGFINGNVYATEMTGPLLFRNPDLLDVFASKLCRELAPCTRNWYGEMKEAYRHVENVLNAAAGK